jgi:hypothetical protein
MPPNRPPHTVPLGRASLFERFPGNKLPGYDHSVPSGHLPKDPCVLARLSVLFLLS